MVTPQVEHFARNTWKSPIHRGFREPMDPLFKQILVLIALGFAIFALLVIYVIARTNGV